MSKIEQAASELDYELRQYSWFQAVGIGGLGPEEELIVFLQKRTKHQLLKELTKTGWQGFSVQVKYVGRIKAA